MIKRLVFDLDNTLIEWKDEYIFALKNVLNKLDVSCNDEELKNFDKAVVSYEKDHYIYNKRDFADFVNSYCHSNLPIEFVDLLILEQGKCYEEDLQLVNTIKYLSSKYDLVLLSNWFTETQKTRLEGIGILKYFTFVSGGDERPLKPSLEAFDCIFKGYKAGECVMIGDSLNNDIIPAVSLGMQAIWLTNTNSKEYKTIKCIYDLKNIL